MTFWCLKWLIRWGTLLFLEYPFEMGEGENSRLVVFLKHAYEIFKNYLCIVPAKTWKENGE